MSRTGRRFVVVAGCLLVAVGVAATAVSLASGRSLLPRSAVGSVVLATLLVLAGLAVAVVVVARSPPEGASSSALDPPVQPAPERTRGDPPLSGRALRATLDDACETAREDSYAAGEARVRQALRSALVEALVSAGRDRAAVERAVDDGTWTDDPVAAAVLSASVTPPRRRVVERLREWLYPDRLLRRRTRRAVQAVAETAAAEQPRIAGETAPRVAEVPPPALERLSRGVDGRIHPAVDPDAIERPGPPDDGPVRGRPSDDPDGGHGPAAETSGERGREPAAADSDHRDEPADNGGERT